MVYLGRGIKLSLTILLRLNIFLTESCFTLAFEEVIAPSVLEYEEEAWVPVKYEEQDNSEFCRAGDDLRLRDRPKVGRIEFVSAGKPRFLKNVFNGVNTEEIKRENFFKNLTKRKSDNYIHFYKFGQSDNELNLRNDMREVEKSISTTRLTPLSGGSDDVNIIKKGKEIRPNSFAISNDYKITSPTPVKVYNKLTSTNNTYKANFKQGNTVKGNEQKLSNDSDVQISGRQFNTQKMKPEKLIVRIPPSYDKLPIFVYKDPLSSKVSFSIVGNLIAVEDTTRSQFSSIPNRISNVPESNLMNNNLSQPASIYPPPNYGKFKKISRPYPGFQYIPYMQYPQYPYLSQFKVKAMQKNLMYPGLYVQPLPPPIINFKMPVYNHWRKFIRLVRNPK